MRSSSCISLVNSEYSQRLYRCWPGSYFSPKCSARLSFLSGCFGAGAYRRTLLKPTAAFGEQSERLPKSGLFFCRRRSWQVFSDTSTWGTFWESFFSGAPERARRVKILEETGAQRVHAAVLALRGGASEVEAVLTLVRGQGSFFAFCKTLR